MKVLKNTLGFGVAGLLLSACVTSGMQGEEANKFKMLFSTKCQLVTYYDGTPDPSTKRKVSDGIWVMSIKEGKNNWKRADISADSFRGDLFHNSVTDETVCGAKNWSYRNRAKGLNDVFK